MFKWKGKLFFGIYQESNFFLISHAYVLLCLCTNVYIYMIGILNGGPQGLILVKHSSHLFSTLNFEIKFGNQKNKEKKLQNLYNSNLITRCYDLSSI